MQLHFLAQIPPHSLETEIATFALLRQLYGCGLMSLVWFLSSSEEQSDELYRKLSPSSSSLSLKSLILPFFEPVLPWKSDCSSPSDFSWPLLVPFCFSASWAACSLAFLLLFHFMRLFWNQILTWKQNIGYLNRGHNVPSLKQDVSADSFPRCPLPSSLFDVTHLHFQFNAGNDRKIWKQWNKGDKEFEGRYCRYATV